MLYKNGRPYHYADRKTAPFNILIGILLTICGILCLQGEGSIAVSLIAFALAAWQFAQAIFKFNRNDDAGYD